MRGLVEIFRFIATMQLIKKNRLAFVLFVQLLLLLPSSASAAGAGPAHISHLTWYAINFVLYVLIVWYLTKEPFKRFWKSRRLDIAETVGKNEKQLDQINAQLSEARQKLATLTPEKLASVVNDIKTTAKNEAELLVNNAQQQAEQIALQAKSTVEAERLRSQSRLRKDIAEEVMKKAEAKIKSTYSSDVDKSRRQQALKSTGSLLD